MIQLYKINRRFYGLSDFNAVHFFEGENLYDIGTATRKLYTTNLECSRLGLNFDSWMSPL